MTKPCYGTMFPDLDRIELNKPLCGQAFEVTVQSHGIGVSARQIKVLPDGWEQCTQCEQYRNCYDLSMAKLALQNALANRL
jgi:hypothetical protein